MFLPPAGLALGAGTALVAATGTARLALPTLGSRTTLGRGLCVELLCQRRLGFDDEFLGSGFANLVALHHSLHNHGRVHATGIHTLDHLFGGCVLRTLDPGLEMADLARLLVKKLHSDTLRRRTLATGVLAVTVHRETGTKKRRGEIQTKGDAYIVKILMMDVCLCSNAHPSCIGENGFGPTYTIIIRSNTTIHAVHSHLIYTYFHNHVE